MDSRRRIKLFPGFWLHVRKFGVFYVVPMALMIGAAVLAVGL